MELPPHATRLTLPNNDGIRILAICVAHENPEVTPAQPLYDTLKWSDTKVAFPAVDETCVNWS